MNLHSLLTVKVMSGRVQHATKFASAMRLRYSEMVRFASMGSGQSFLENTVFGWQGIAVGLHSLSLARSRSTAIVLVWDNEMNPFTVRV